MAGNVAQLQADIDAAFNVSHDGTSKRGSIAEALANAFDAYVQSLQVKGATVIVVPMPCNAGGPHPEVEIEGYLE